MIYSLDNTVKAGKPCDVFDRNGHEISRVTWCDTETGEVERYKENNGSIVISKCGNFAERETIKYPSPLEVKFRENK